MASKKNIGIRKGIKTKVRKRKGNTNNNGILYPSYMLPFSTEFSGSVAGVGLWVPRLFFFSLPLSLFALPLPVQDYRLIINYIS